MDDDFNTPEAIAVLQRMTREINLAKDTGKEKKAVALSAELRSLAQVLGIISIEPEQWFRLAKPAQPGVGQHVLQAEAGVFNVTGQDVAAAVGDSGTLADAEIDKLVATRIRREAWARTSRSRIGFAICWRLRG